MIAAVDIVVPSLLDAALGYAREGFDVFPLWWVNSDGVCGCGDAHDGSSKARTGRNVGKHPITPNGFKDATTDEATIRRWWSQRPEANVGIRGGVYGTRHLVVIDFDRDNGKDGMRSFIALAQRLEVGSDEFMATFDTRQVSTGGGGLHLYFWSPVPMRSTQDETKLGPGIHVRCVGGYVVTPPSLHRSGRRYQRYGETATVAHLPAWLLDALAPLTIKTNERPQRAHSTTTKPDNEKLKATINGRPITDFARDEQMLGPLAPLGLDTGMIDQRFDCVLPGCPCGGRSAILYADEPGLLRYRCFLTDERWTLAHLFCIQTVGYVELPAADPGKRPTWLKLGNAELAAWQLRLIAEAGLATAAPIDAPAVPKEFKRKSVRLYRGFLQLVGLWTMTEEGRGRPQLYTYRFAERWCGFPLNANKRFGFAMSQLTDPDFGVLDKLDELPVIEGRPATWLYALRSNVR